MNWLQRVVLTFLLFVYLGVCSMGDQDLVNVVNWFHENAAFFNFGSIMTFFLVVAAFAIRWFTSTWPSQESSLSVSQPVTEYPTLPEPMQCCEPQVQAVAVRTVVHVPSDLTLQFLVPLHAKTKSLIQLNNTTRPNQYGYQNTEFMWGSIDVRFIVEHTESFSWFRLCDIKLNDVAIRSSITDQDFDLLREVAYPLIEEAHTRTLRDLAKFAGDRLRTAGVA